MFLDKFQTLCKNNETKVRAVAKELGIGSSTVSKWLNGSTPRLEHIIMIAEYFNVSLDYLAGNEEISIKPSGELKSAQSLLHRFVSLSRGISVSNEDILKIAAYTNCSMLFLLREDLDNLRFIPEAIVEIDNLARVFDLSTLQLILNIMDKCAGSEPFRVLQVQLSRIVLYQLQKVGIIPDMLIDSGCFESGKIQYLAFGDDRKTVKYGFNYSDLIAILERYDGVPNFQFMFTGIADDPIELLKNNSELKKKILGE